VSAGSQALARWLKRQQTVHAKSIDLSLTRVTTVARRLGVDRLHCPVITVGGTNGKGSVVAHLQSLLHAAGLSAGVFTSPHLLRYNERIQVNGTEVADEEIVAAFERIESARGTVTLTYFEYNTLAALLIFAARAVDVAVLEVGLGGRLDATNLIDAAVAVVTSIGFDHRDWLGDTLDAIGREKAGIFRAGRPAVLGSPDMPASVFAAIESIGAQPVVAERDFRWQVAPQSWSYEGGVWRFERLPPPALPGSIQYRNAATAMAALEAWGRTEIGDREIIAAGLSQVALKGRFQIVPGPVEWILDVAHNEPAARVLATHLRERPCAGRTFAVLSVLADKDIAAIGRELAPLIDDWILCSITEPRGLDATQVRERLALPQGAQVLLADSVTAGCERARALAQPSDRVVACGSFWVVGAALAALGLY